MIPRNEITEDIPLDTVGSSTFGRYPKISQAKTFNMIMTDDWMADYAGYKSVTSQNSITKLPDPINPNGKGRGIYHSTKLDRIVAVVYNGVYLIDSNINKVQIGTLATFNGDVFIAEDVQGHLAICDKVDIWIYTESTGTFLKATRNGVDPLDFVPGYVCYHDGRFISVNLQASQWRLSDPDMGNSQFPSTSQFVGQFQTKPDNPVAVIPLPGKANNILVIGSILGQFWNDVGAALFPYQLSQSVNLDVGTLSSDTVAIDKDIVAWLAGNEKSGPFIVYSTGGTPTKISTDGIDFLLGNLTNPEDSHAFFFRQDGHLIYQITFVTDNLSLIYDFNTQKFFNVSDENMNYHPAKRAVYFNNTYYFVSLNDGNLYQFDTNITEYNYGYNSKQQYIEKEIPRVRICSTNRSKGGENKIWNNLSIPFEMGTQPDPGMSVAKIILTDPGTGYTSATVVLLGGGGQGATATVNILGDFILMDGTDFLLMDGTDFMLMGAGGAGAITVTNPGANYSTAPDVVIIGDGTGMGATAVLTINTLPRADLSVSHNGAMTFTGDAPIYFNTEGHYKNRFTWFDGMGCSNEITVQLRLWSKGRFIMGKGIMGAYV